MPAQRKTTALKRLQGTARADRAPRLDYSARLTEAPPAPKGMATTAARHWDHVAAAAVGIGTLTAADLPMLELLANTLAAEADARTALDRDGFTTDAGSGGKKKHPAAAIAETARAQALALFREFGLSPRSRQGVDQAPGVSQNPFARDGVPSPWSEFATARETLTGCRDTDTDTPRPRGRIQ